MLKKKQILLLILMIGMVFVAYSAIGQEETIGEEIQGSVGNIWTNIKWPIIAAVSMFIFQGILYVISLFKKDRLQKTILNKYVVFHMKNGHRYQGTMRLDSRGAEIVSEESRQRGHAPSYIFRQNELDNRIGAYIRYLDTMNDREKQERKWDYERLINPPLSHRVVRKTRNMVIELNAAAKNAISMVWGGIKQMASPLQTQLARVNTEVKALGGEAASLDSQIQEMEGETSSFLQEESYERIIERLVGTRVKIRIDKVEHANGEYMALFKDYNKKHMSFMNVRDKDNNGFRDQWRIEVEYKGDINNFNRRDDRGLRCRMIERDGKYFLVFENNTSYSVQVGKIRLFDPGGWERNLEFKWHIDPLSVRRIQLNPVVQHRVGPFERVTTPERLTPRNFKKISLEFRSYRDADVIFPRKEVCTIIESAEKRQQELFTISALTDAILDRSDTEEIPLQDSQGKAIHGMNLVHDYVTNVNEERIDLKTIDSSYSRRWEVESAYSHFDNSLRLKLPIHRRTIPYFANRIASQNILVEQISENQLHKETFSQLTLPTKSRNGKPRIPLKKILPKPEFKLPLKVMTLTGNSSNHEFPILQQFEYVSQHHMLYESVNNLRNDRLAKMDILWIGNGEIYKSGYRLNIDTEHRIKNFASQGGIVIVSGQDIRTNSRQRRGAGWIPEPLTGIEYEETDECLPTSKGRRSKVFRTPHVLNTTPDTKEVPGIRLDDMWVDPLGKWNSLAESITHDASALLTLPFQQGLYIVTSLKNDTENDVKINHKFMENLLHFSVRWKDNQRWRQRLIRR